MSNENKPHEKPLPRLPDVKVLIAKWSVDCGQRVADRRIAVGWSRTRLGAVVGTTEATVARIEGGQLNPRDHLKLAIAAALAVEVEQLWPMPRIAELIKLKKAAA